MVDGSNDLFGSTIAVRLRRQMDHQGPGACSFGGLQHQTENNMREVCELRVVEEFASQIFDENEGKRLGYAIRKIMLATDDPRFYRVGELQRETLAALRRLTMELLGGEDAFLY